MTEWKEYKLEEIIDTFIDYRGKTPKKGDSGIPLVTAKVVKAGKILPPNEFIPEDEYENWMIRGYPKKNDIVLTTEAPLGEVALIKDENIALAQRIITMRGNPNIMSNVFLKYYLQSAQGQYELDSRASGTTVFGIKASILKKLPVLLPELPEQCAIASILSGLDDKIDLLHRQNKTLEEIAETLFKQWFVFNASEEWKVKKLEEILSVTSSKRIFYKEYIEKGIPFYRSKEIIELSKGGSTSTELFISEERFNEISSKYGSPKQGDILLTSVGTLGVSYRVRKKDKFYFKDGNLTWFSNFKDLPGILIYCWLNSSLGKEELNNITIGSTQPALTIAGLRQIEIKIPPQKIIKKLENELNTLYSKIDFNQIQNHTLEKLRDTLLPKLMNGEVKVLFDELKKEIV